MGTYQQNTTSFMIHIGKQIRQKMEERQTVVWLSKHLSCSRANVYKIFEKYSVDTEMLAENIRYPKF